MTIPLLLSSLQLLKLKIIVPDKIRRNLKMIRKRARISKLLTDRRLVLLHLGTNKLSSVGLSLSLKKLQLKELASQNWEDYVRKI